MKVGTHVPARTEKRVKSIGRAQAADRNDSGGVPPPAHIIGIHDGAIGCLLPEEMPDWDRSIMILGQIPDWLTDACRDRYWREVERWRR